MDGGPRRNEYNDGAGHRSVCRLRCMDWSIERYVNASPCTGSMSGACDLLRCPQVEFQPVVLLTDLQMKNARGSSSIW